MIRNRQTIFKTLESAYVRKVDQARSHIYISQTKRDGQDRGFVKLRQQFAQKIDVQPLTIAEINVEDEREVFFLLWQKGNLLSEAWTGFG